MAIRITTILSLVISICFACKQIDKKKTQVIREFPNKMTLTAPVVTQFELDSVTAPYIGCMQYIFDTSFSGSNMLAFLNEETGSIYLNDMKSKKIIKRIEPDVPLKQLKKSIQGFYYLNKDSIFLFEFRPNILLINDLGKVQKIFKIQMPKGDRHQQLACRGVTVETKNPAYVSNGKLYFSSMVVGKLSENEKRSTQLVLDLKTNNVSVGAPVFPENYSNNYGGLHYFIFSSAINELTNRIVYSFPASDSIAVNSLSNQDIKKCYAGSKHVGEIPEFKESDFADAPSGAEGEYFMRTPSYGPVLFDRYRNLYYRLAFLPVEVKNALYEEKNAPTKTISVIMMDSAFRYLGEQVLEKNKFWPNSAFVSKEGLNIQNKTSYDSTLDFSLFIPTNISSNSK